MPEHSTIRVRFIDAKTEQLAQSFEAATSLDMGENTFEVERIYTEHLQAWLSGQD